jgi:hypothetical protein
MLNSVRCYCPAASIVPIAKRQWEFTLRSHAALQLSFFSDCDPEEKGWNQKSDKPAKYPAKNGFRFRKMAKNFYCLLNIYHNSNYNLLEDGSSS